MEQAMDEIVNWNTTDKFYLDKKHHDKVLEMIHSYFTDVKHCDIVLESGRDRKRVSAHRVFLFANTPYFDGMLNDGMKEANEDVITIQEVTGDILQALISYCYTGKMLIHDQNVDEILAAASSMEFIGIEKLCEEFYLDSLSPSNCLGFRLVAIQFNLMGLKGKAENMIMDQFQLVVQQEEFQNVSIENLKWLLQQDNVYIYSEEEIFNTLIRWIEIDEEDRKRYFSDLAFLPRIQQFKQSFLLETVRKYCQKWNQSQLFLNLVEIHLNKDADQQLQPRICLLQPALWSIVKMSNGCEIEKFDVIGKEWRSIFKSTEFRQPQVAIQINEFLYMFGEMDNHVDEQTTVKRLNFRTWKVNNLTPMISKRTVLAAADANNSIYCLSKGSDNENTTFERYDIANNTWTELAQIPESSSAYSMASCSSSVYVIGTNSSKKMFSLSYNQITGAWDPIPPIRFSAENAVLDNKLCVSNGSLYLINVIKVPNRHLISCLVYDLAAKKWSGKSGLFVKDNEFCKLNTTVVYKGIPYVQLQTKTTIFYVKINADEIKQLHGHEINHKRNGLGIFIVPCECD